MLAEIHTGNVVDSYPIGNTNIFICDDACRDAKKEDIEAVLSETLKIALEIKMQNAKAEDP